MLSKWQFNVLFIVGVGGAVLLLLGPDFGVHVSRNPTAIGGVGAILTYVLTQRNSFTKHDTKPKQEDKNEKPKQEDKEVDE